MNCTIKYHGKYNGIIFKAILTLSTLILPLFQLMAHGYDSSSGKSSETSPDSIALSRVEALQALADTGDKDALYHLATLYDRGYGPIVPDTVRSTELYIRAAEAGHNEAQNYLGYRLYRGDGVERNVEQALQWLENSAMAGNARAAGNLGYLLLYGDGVAHDDENAAFWLQIAADKGVATAMSMLGDLYMEGKGVELDSVKGMQYYRRAFERGLADAGYKLEAAQKDSLAAMPPGQLTDMGLYYYLRGLPEIAVPIFEKAAEGGDARAYALLGDAYTRALGVSYDHRKALDNYFLSAIQGYPPAQFIIGELLEIFPDALSGLSPEIIARYPDREQDALWWTQKAYQGGVPDARTANKLLLSEKPI